MKKERRVVKNKFCTEGGNRTRTRFRANRILSPACLPVPPLQLVSTRRIKLRAKDEIRTRDPNLGKVVLYQLSYFRL